MTHEGKELPFVDRHVIALGGAGVELARTADLLLGVGDHLVPLRDPAGGAGEREQGREHRSEEHTSELQSLMRISYAVFCLKKKITPNKKSCTSVEVNRI